MEGQRLLALFGLVLELNHVIASNWEAKLYSDVKQRGSHVYFSGETYSTCANIGGTIEAKSISTLDTCVRVYSSDNCEDTALMEIRPYTICHDYWERCELVNHVRSIRGCAPVSDVSGKVTWSQVGMDSGNISSPNYPQNYDNNVDISWSVIALPKHNIQITFVDFQLEDHSSCGYDVVTVIDPISEQVLYKGCGNKLPPTINVDSNQFMVTFTSDQSQRKKGFSLKWKIVEDLPKKIKAPCKANSYSGMVGKSEGSSGSLASFSEPTECSTKREWERRGGGGGGGAGGGGNGGGNGGGGAGLIDTNYRWQKFSVYPDHNLTHDEYALIINAMFQLQQALPCISFHIWPKESRPTGDYIKIVKGTTNGCNSWVGKLGGEQIMNLESPGCMNLGTVFHEMFHALGFHHEHLRPDRDDFVDIHYENIKKGFDSGFQKWSADTVDTYQIPYDFNSIMHYSSYAFSANGCATITQKDGNVTPTTPVWQATKLSENDKRRLQRMYNC